MHCSFFGYLIYFLLTKIFTNRLKKFGKKVIQRSEGITKKIFSLSSMYKEYLMSNLINEKVDDLIKLNFKYRILEAKTAYLKVSSSILIQGLIISFTILFLVFNQDGSINSDQFATLASLIYTIQRSVPLLQKILRASNTINSGFPAFEAFENKNQLFENNLEIFPIKKKLSKNSQINNNELIRLLKVQIPHSKSDLKTLTYSFKKFGCTGIIGKSGSGKTSLLNMIAGLDNKQEGIFIEGKNLKSLSKENLIKWRKRFHLFHKSLILLTVH